jgi:hypothetical protein
MNATLLILTLTVFAADDGETPRKRSAIAPSLPALTQEEEDKLDDIVNRFTDADIGRLRGVEARKAVKEFEALQMEAVPALIRGLNRAAGLQHSCPVLTIGKKLHSLLMRSNDQELLEYARDEIGAGVGRSRYAGTLQELRFSVLMRKNAVARATPPPRPLTTLSTTDLVKSIGSEKGPRLKPTLIELSTRKEPEALAGLLTAAASTDRDTQKLARTLLDAHLIRGGADLVKEQLTSDNAEARQSAARAAAARFPTLAPYVAELVVDERPLVRAEARAALVKMAKSEDFGPEPDASPEQRREAREKWIEHFKK